MAEVIVLTPSPVRLTATGKQSLQTSLDVSDQDELDLLLGIVGIEGAGPFSVIVRILTGMQTDSEDGWVIAATFATLSGSNQYVKLNVPGLLKYVRFELSTFTGGTAVTIAISGMGRVK